jgi:HD-GYP domain-containing protein (c-di-GMP phosphodiesterase class II)
VSVPVSRTSESGIPDDAPARASGPTLLSRLSALIRLGRSYQIDNQVFLGQLDSFMAVLQPILEANGELVLVELDDDLFLNGTRIPVRGISVRFHRHVTEEFRRRQIAGFRALRGTTVEDVKVFFRLFNQPDLYNGPELLSACIAQGLDKILPAVHASTYAPDARFDLGLALEDAAPAGPQQAGFERSPGDPARSADERIPRGARGHAPRGATRKNFSAAMAGAKSLLTTTSLHGGMELRHAKRVVQPLVDGAFASEPVVVGLGTLTHHDEYTYAHAVNVTLVAVTMGHFLEMDRRALADLGVAALLHDVGKSAVARKIQNPLESFTPEEEELAQRHPVEGVKLLARSTTLNSNTLRCMRVCLEHHAGPEGGGYPALGREWHTSLLSRLVAVADCYVSLQMHRSLRGSFVTPFESLGMMLGPLKSRFHPAMLWALVQTVGFYPPGQLVELDDGVLAAVLAPNAADPARPHLRPLFAPDGRRFEAGEAPDLRPLPADRSVKRALRGAEYPSTEASAA